MAQPLSPAIPRILLVDDEADICRLMRRILEPEGYYCDEARDGGAAVEALRRQPYDLVFTDLVMPGIGGLDLIREISGMSRKPLVIVLTGQANLEVAVEAMNLGAYDFLTKPFQPLYISTAARRALEHFSLISQNERLERQARNCPTYANLVGQSPAMLTVFNMIAQVAPTNANVLITGESGTGKERAARAIHENSARGKKCFNVIDCTAIPEGLMESTLFGHKKGAFSGATSDYMGLVPYSDGGTVFFDEIGEMPPHLQSKMLRLLQERSFKPVGGTQDIHVNIRVLAASNRNLEEEVSKGRFREDLYYRLNVVPLHMPPLRERGNDVVMLSYYFLDQFAHDSRKTIKGISPEALDCLRFYSWPGNVRELRNAIEHAASMTHSVMIQPEDLPLKIQESLRNLPVPATGEMPREQPEALEKFENLEQLMARTKREYLTRLLIHFKGNPISVAEAAGVSRATLYRMLESANLEIGNFRAI